jgi:hypothetical protein
MGKKLIMLAGRKRSGKDTSGKLIKQLDPRAKLLSFAAPMKQIIATTLDIDLNDLEDWKNNEYVLMHGIPPENQDNTSFRLQTYRSILQNFGSEAMKPVFGDDVWSSVSTKYISNMFEFTDTVIITDFRFKAEYEYLSEYYRDTDITILTVKIERPGLLQEDLHISERDLDDWDFMYSINNDGTEEKLKEKLKEIL